MPNIDVRKSTAKASSWDDFAQACNASFRCAYRATRIWQFEVSPTHQLCRLELYVRENDRDVKIGQCAVGISATMNTFADSIQLLPQYKGLWSDAMRAILEKLGPGVYGYGSQFNVEDSREAELKALRETYVDDVDDFLIEYVDFTQWSTWETYFQSLSENVRRNVKKAAKHYEGYKLNMTDDFDIGRAVKFLTLRNKVYTRKNLNRSAVLVFLRSFLRIFALPKYSDYAYFEVDKKVVAGYCGVNFGENVYYMEGGSEKDNKGASWCLLINVMARAWARSKGQGRFVMGASGMIPNPEDKSWEGLDRSRKQCRVTAQVSSIIRFTYKGQKAHVPARARLIPALIGMTPSSLIAPAGKNQLLVRMIFLLGAHLLVYRWRMF